MIPAPTSPAEPDRKRALLHDLLSVTTGDLYPLSLAQQRLYFLHQLEPDTGIYNLGFGVRLSGDLNVQNLTRALNAIVDRHEALRTGFVTVNGEVVQRVSSNARVAVPEIDFQSIPDGEREQRARVAAGRDFSRTFDLSQAPMIRALLLRMGPRDCILAVTIHHLAGDGISIGIFLEELRLYYSAFCENTEPSLPELPIHYADYAQWQRDWLSREDMAGQIRYWTKNLEGVPALLDLPTDRPRPSEQSFSGAAVSMPLEADLVEQLTELARQEGATLFTFLLSVFQVLLHRYSGQDDISVGIPVAGRGRVEVERLIGFFVNTVVVRTNCSGNPRFRDLLAQVRGCLIEAYANQDVPFEKIVEEIHPPRSLAYNPVFQVTMTSLRGPAPSRPFGPLNASPYVTGASTSRFDLSAAIIEAANGTLWWQLEYSTALFDADRIWRMMNHLKVILARVARDPDQRIDYLEILTAPERSQLDGWNETEASYPRKTIHALIADQAARDPGRIAVVSGGRQITAADLQAQVQRIARALLAAGAGPGTRVALCVDRSVEMVAAVLAVLTTGAAYVPLDPAYPAERLAFLLNDCQSHILLTEPGLSERCPGNVNRVFLSEALSAAHADMAVEPTRGDDPESLAYVIYTSGSTGRPNGVCITHRSVVNVLWSMRERLRTTDEDRLLAVTTICFDIAGLELFLPLICGTRLVIASRDVVADGGELRNLIDQCGITMMQATPATWRLLIGAGWGRTSKFKVLCGGEAMPDDLARQLTDRCDSVWNLYGPTETTIWSSISRVRKHAPVLIGRPIHNTRFHVLDRAMRPVPVGVPGELYIGGDGLAREYWSRPELTLQRFVPDPLSLSGGRIYKTGDRVRFCPDGGLEYLGRADGQVKVRGFRIELAEVESAVAEHPSVLQAAAAVQNDPQGDPRLTCWVVARPGCRLEPSEVLATLRTALPEYMIPMLIPVSSLPLTANGKVDRAALRSNQLSGFEDSGQTPPRDIIEQQLTGIWEALLGVRPIGIRDSFFDIGGHSLLAVKMFEQVRTVFGRTLRLSTIFRKPTIEYLAAQLRNGDPAAGTYLVPIQETGENPPLFVAGSNPWFDKLSELLGPSQPFFKMDYYAALERRVEAGEPLFDVPEMAAQFVREIRSKQPVGPYFLAGECDGGLLIYETAKQLERQGETVGLLVIWETARTGYLEPSRQRMLAYYSLRALKLLFTGEFVPVLLRMRAARAATRSIPTEDEQRHHYIYNSLWAAVRRYSNSEKFHGRIDVVRAADRYYYYPDTSVGWEDMSTGPIVKHVTPGDHVTFRSIHQEEFAQLLSRLLREASSRADFRE